VPSPAEIAYREAVRALEGQAQDLENIRTHVSIVLTAGGVAIAFFASQHPGRGDAFVVAAAAFGVIAVMTVCAYWPITFAWDFNAYDLVTTYVDCDPPCDGDFAMRELAIHAGDDYLANRPGLTRLHILQMVALVAFGTEAIALLYHLAVE
jgi:hypothetical protein